MNPVDKEIKKFYNPADREKKVSKRQRKSKSRLAARRKVYDEMPEGPKKNGYHRPGSRNRKK